MRAPPFPSAIGAALCAHAAVASALVLVPRSRPAAASAPSVSQELFFVTQEPSPPEPPPAPDVAAPSPSPPPARAVAPRGPLLATAAHGQAPSSIDDAREPHLDVPAPADSSVAWSLPQTGPTELGIGAYWKSVARGGGGPSGPQPEPSRDGAPSAIRMVRDELAAHDHELGLGVGGPLVAAAHEAASPAFAPDTGSAIFDVEADATGTVTSAQLVSSGADSSAWNDVARELVKRMASPSKRLHLASGARGLRARLRITAERTLPSGERKTENVGAVPDDVPGQGGSACVGTGAQRKCLAGSPVGLTGSIGDLSNIGARASRIVHVELLSEATQ